jgi:hypothetical protein
VIDVLRQEEYVVVGLKRTAFWFFEVGDTKRKIRILARHTVVNSEK